MAFTGSGKAGNGPSDVPRDRHKRYLIPRYPLDVPMTPEMEPIKGEGMEQPWTRVSTIAKAMADQFGLTRWQIRMTVKGISIRPDLYALAASTRIDDTRQLDDIGDQAKDAAKARAGGNLGTALHAFTDQVDAGETPEIPAPWDADIAAYTKGLADHGIKIVKEWREQRVVLPHVRDGKAAGVAGTLDSIVLYNGQPTIADLKTGKDPLKYGAGEVAIQEGCYGNAWAMWDGEHFRPMPANLNKNVALVFHLRPGEAKLDIYEVDISGAMADVSLAMQVRAWRSRVGSLYHLITPGEPASPIAVLEQEVQPDESTPIEQAMADPGPKRGKTPDMLEQERIRDERLAKISAATNPNDGDPEDQLTPETLARLEAARSTSDADVDFELAPLAGPGERGCSVCGRKGHRKGSAKCLGDRDPAKLRAQDGLSVATPEEAASVPDGVWCHCTNRSAGWKPDPTNPDGPWVCGDCELPSKEIVQHEVGDTVTVAGTEFTKIGESPFPGQVTAAELNEAANRHEGDPAEIDPFADEDGDSPILSEEEALWHQFLDLISEADTKARIREIRSQATEAGVWDDQLLQAGLKRLQELPKPS